MADESLSFLARLKQHHIYRVVAGYAVGAWIVMQAATRVFPYFGWSGAVPILIIILILGFPVILVLAWMFIKPKDPAKSGWQQRHWKLGAGFSIAVLILVVISGFYVWRFSARHAQLSVAAAQPSGVSAVASSSAPASATLIPAKSIAVLPFENLSGDKNNAYFAAGIQDEILTKLASIRDLKVISRTSTENYGSHPGNLKSIANQLGVAHILEGSVQKAGNQVLINVQLIDANTDAHLWASDYQRTLDNIFGVEGEVAQKVAEALQAELLPKESARIANIPTKNSQAWDLYLKGMYYLNQVDTESAKDPAEAGQRALTLFDAAIATDPDFALAYAKLSYLESFSYWYGIDTSAQALQTARDAAERALTLQPGLPEAHLAMGYVHYWGHRDYAAALAEFGKARAGLPNNAQVLEGIAFIHRRLGKVQEAIEALQQAAVLDPQDSTVTREIGNAFLLLRRYSEAQAAYQRALVLVPDDVEALVGQTTSLMMSGDTQAAGHALAAIPADDDPQGSVSLARFQLALLTRQPDAALAAIEHAPIWITDRFEHSRMPLTLLRGQALMMNGDARQAHAAFFQAQQALEGQLGKPREQADAESYLAIVYAGLGEKSKALEAGRRATERVPLSRDVIVGGFYLTRLAKVEAQVGETQAALEYIKQLMAAPCGQNISTAVLQIDPAWDPIRNDPRFQALLKKYGTSSRKP